MRGWQTEIIERTAPPHRIQVRQVCGVWVQRHVWYRDGYAFADGWIRGLQGEPGEDYHEVEDLEQAALESA